MNPVFADAYYNRGNIYVRIRGLKSENIKKAIDDYTKAIVLKPDCVDYYDSRGFAYLLDDDYSRAIDDYTKAIELGTTNAFVYYMRGVNCYINNDYRSTIPDCTKAIELNPKFAEAYFLRGNAYKEMGKMEKAKSDHMKAMKLGFEG